MCSGWLDAYLGDPIRFCVPYLCRPVFPSPFPLLMHEITHWLAGWLTLWWLVAGDDWMACLLPACLPWFSCNQSNNSQTYIKWHYIILLAAWLQSGWAERINRDWNAHQPSLHTAISRRWLFAGIVIKPQRPAEITIYTHIGCCGGWWWWWNAVLG